MAEPPAKDFDQVSSFTHREYKPHHEPHPTPKGIPYPPLMTSQKAASLLNKVAVKSKMAAGKGKPKPGKTIISHGRKN